MAPVSAFAFPSPLFHLSILTQKCTEQLRHEAVLKGKLLEEEEEEKKSLQLTSKRVCRRVMLTSAQREAIEAKRKAAIEIRRRCSTAAAAATAAPAATRSSSGRDWRSEDPTAVFFDAKRAYKRHQQAAATEISRREEGDDAWRCAAPKEKQPKCADDAQKKQQQQKQPRPTPPLVVDASAVAPASAAVAAAAVPCEDDDDDDVVIPRKAASAATSPFFGWVQKKRQPAALQQPPPQQQKRVAPEDFRCSPSPSTPSPAAATLARSRQSPPKATRSLPHIPGHTVVADVKSLRAFCEAHSSSRRSVVAHYLSNGVSSFRTPKSLPPAILAPDVVGISILPDCAPSPFFFAASTLLAGGSDEDELASDTVYVVSEFLGSAKPKICFDSQSFCRALSSKLANLLDRIEFSTVFDPKLAAWLRDPDADQDTLEFAELAFEHLSTRETAGLTVPECLASDMQNALMLADKLQKLLKKENLMQGFSFETVVIPILADMEHRGVVFNPDAFKRYKQLLQERLYLIDKMADNIAGFSVNLSSPKQVGHVLYDVLKLQPPAQKHGSKTTAASTSERAIKLLCEKNPFPRLVLEHRHCQKLLSTYVFALEDKARKEHGVLRIHCQWQHMCTGTGRLSSANPNMQNLPRGIVKLPAIQSEAQELALNIRDAFGCREGHVLVASDYSQIELRVLAHFTKDPRLIASFRDGTDFHSNVAALVCRKPIGSVTDDERSKAKRVVFGVLYGMGIHTLAEILRTGIPEAERWRNAFFDQFPGVKRFISETVAHARRERSVRTLFGRVRLVQGIVSDNKGQRARAERQAVNTIIQGSAADIMKAAMVRLFSQLPAFDAHIVLQIHDEVVVEAPESAQEEVCRAIQQAMENPMPDGILDVPIPVKVSVGKRWGSLNPVSEAALAAAAHPEEDEFYEGMSANMEEDSELFE